MRIAKILFKDEEAGFLTQHDDGTFTFRYHDSWISDIKKASISLTLPTSNQEYHSTSLFPFFYNLLPEGSNKQLICKHHRLDHDDFFGLLMTIAKYDTIGAVTVIKIEEE